MQWLSETSTNSQLAALHRMTVSIDLCKWPTRRRVLCFRPEETNATNFIALIWVNPVGIVQTAAAAAGNVVYHRGSVRELASVLDASLDASSLRQISYV